MCAASDCRLGMGAKTLLHWAGPVLCFAKMGHAVPKDRPNGPCQAWPRLAMMGDVDTDSPDASPGKEPTMENVKLKKTGNKLTLEIDLGVDGRESSTGVSTLYASTGGFKPIPGAGPGVKLNLIVMRKHDEA